MNAKQMARALGWFSIGLGLAEVIAPRRVSELTGRRGHDGLVRAFGVREIASGVGLLTARQSSGQLSKWMWARLGGDVMDLALLGTTLTTNNGWSDRNRRKRALATIGILAPVVAADVVRAGVNGQIAKGSLTDNLTRKRSLPQSDRAQYAFFYALSF